MSTYRLLAVITLASLMGWTTASAQVVGKVYGVSMSGSLVESEEVAPEVDKLVKGAFTTQNIINVARGRSPEAATPANEKLAMELFFPNAEDNPVCLLAVFDTVGQSNLVVIAQFMVSGAFDSEKGKGYIALVGTINSVGNFTGGWLSIIAKATLNFSGNEPVLTAFSGALQGTFEGLDDEEDDFEVIAPKGKVALTGELGTTTLNDSNE
jgi:hypothetical protein